MLIHSNDDNTLLFIFETHKINLTRLLLLILGRVKIIFTQNKKKRKKTTNQTEESNHFFIT